MTYAGGIEVSNLTVTFSRWGQEVRALNGLSLSVPLGQWVMIVGHNGSGKSTLLKALSGRLHPDSGEIRIGGNHISEMRRSQIAESVFLVNQDPLMGTAPKLTLFQNLLAADQQAQSGASRKRDLVDKYREFLRPLGLADRMQQLARNLSPGERQLLALLVARLRPSPIMLLDEPLAALDPGKADLCMREIEALSRQGRTLLQVTHDEKLAVSTGARTVAIRSGSIVYDDLGSNRHLVDIRKIWSPLGE